MSGPELPPLGLGAANVGNLHRELSDDDAWELLNAAWESGIRYFDTAPHYGLGLSERRLGDFLRTKPREDFVLSTKVGRLLVRDVAFDGGLDTANDFWVAATHTRVWDFSTAGIRESLRGSQERLGIERIDVAYLHDPERHDLDLAVATALPALEALRADGVVGAIGVGSMRTEALGRCVRAADLDVVMLAGRYTLLEQRGAAELFAACRGRGTRVVAASVFNSGLLAHDEPSPSGRYDYGRVPAALWRRLEEIMGICRRHGVALPAAAVQMPLRSTAVGSVVIAGSRPEQIVQNCGYAQAEIPPGFWEDLVRADLVPGQEVLSA